jgi:hypothetical protein
MIKVGSLVEYEKDIYEVELINNDNTLEIFSETFQIGHSDVPKNEVKLIKIL